MARRARDHGQDRGRVRHWALGWWLVVLIVWFVVSIAAGLFAYRIAQDDLRMAAADRAQSIAAVAARTIAQAEQVPEILADAAEIVDALAVQSSPEARHRADLHLERIGRLSGIEVLYVLDRQGVTIASSNWRSPQSFIGQDFSFRPYAQKALQGEKGQYLALGTTSLRPGYFIAVPAANGMGVVVAKLGTDLLEKDWLLAPDILLLTDELGVVVITNRPAWRFLTMEPLAEAVRDRIALSKRYPAQGLAPLPIERGDGIVRVIEGPDAGSYLALSVPLSLGPYGLVVLASIEPATSKTALAVIVTAIMLTIVAYGVVAVLRWRGRERMMIAMLERHVSERTEALRMAQGELVQSAKLATIGQMSASLAHELTQPVAAIRGFAANGLILMERARHVELADNLRAIMAVTDRMGQVARHLKLYARRGQNQASFVPLADLVARTVSALDGRFSHLGIVPVTDIPPDLRVFVDSVGFEQGVINILHNACDVLEERSVREIRIWAEESPHHVQVFLADNGPGLDPDVAGHVFEAFFTTKPPGIGLGLGLSIARDLIEAFGGRIRVDPCGKPWGGAVFVLELPKGPS